MMRTSSIATVAALLLPLCGIAELVVTSTEPLAVGFAGDEMQLRIQV